jgi:hypothetical protein
MEFTNVKLTEIIFRERLAERDYCVIFLVVIRGKTCVMKVVGWTHWLNCLAEIFSDTFHSTVVKGLNNHGTHRSVKRTSLSANRLHIDA